MNANWLLLPWKRMSGYYMKALLGVVARIVTGPHDANRQDSHLPMRYDTGRPRAVIRFRISQPRTTSLPLPGWTLGAKAIADDEFVAEERVSTRP